MISCSLITYHLQNWLALSNHNMRYFSEEQLYPIIIQLLRLSQEFQLLMTRTGFPNPVNS